MNPDDSTGKGSTSEGRHNGASPAGDRLAVTSEQLRDEGFLARFKEFGMTSYAVKHSTASVMLLLILLVVGLVSYGSIPKESSPEIEVPFVAVNTMYPGVSPSDMETLVTRPIEDELRTIADIKEMLSTSVEGYSSITVEFNTNVNLDGALQKVREKVDLARPKLPTDAEEPSIMEFNFSEFPIMQVNVSGEYGLVRLKEVAEELQDKLEQVPSILRVDLSGGLEREVKVDVDLARLQFYNIALDDVVEAIREENVNIPGGSVDVGQMKYLVRVDGEIANPSIIGDFVIAVEDGRPVYVRDVATVDFGFVERASFARLDGTPVVTLDIVKRSGQNIIETAAAVKSAIAEMTPGFPPTTVVKITSDQSEEIFKMVSSLENNIISGLLLIVAVLLFFLGVRNSFFVAISIPASMMLSFIILKFLGVTMNMIVLFSLILALGMLVDNAIVVVENIYRYMEQGWDRVTASRKATGEVAMPVIASTLTTLAAFSPLLFWPGIVGEFMSYLPLTLIVTLSSSLFVALVLVPTLCALFMQLEGAKAAPLTPFARGTLIIGTALLLLMVAAGNPLTAGLFAATGVAVYLMHHFVLTRMARAFQERTMPAIIRGYSALLGWCLTHRAVVVAATVVVFVSAILAFGRYNHGVEFFPEDIPPAQAAVTIESPTGTNAVATDAFAQRIEAELAGIAGVDDSKSVVATVGGSGGNPMMGGGPGGGNAARVTVSFVDFKDRKQDAFVTLANMQRNLGKGMAGADISVDMPQNGPPSGPPVNVEIVGKDPDVLKSLADRVLYILRNDSVYARLNGLESDLDDARPELFVSVDREKAALYDLSTYAVGSAIRGAIQGVEAAKFRTGNDEYDIVVRLAEAYRKDLYSVGDLKVMTEGNPVPLTSVATWEVREGLGMIRRKDMDRVATISSDVAAGENSNAVLASVQATLADFQEKELPPGYALRYTGQSQEQADAQEFLSFAFMMAIMLIALILISQFNSVVKPMIILSTVIVSTIGVLIGLLAFNMPFVIIMTGIGIISLAGIVVNNAIVLIDYVDTLRVRDGIPRRAALLRAGMTRFRPVVLTAITTALGLIPLAIGLNFDFIGLFSSLSPELYWGGEQASWWAPMAIAVIVGILFATFLTLLLVPVLYSIFDDVGDWMKRKYVAGDAGLVPEPAAAKRIEARVPAGVASALLLGLALTLSSFAPVHTAAAQTAGTQQAAAPAAVPAGRQVVLITGSTDGLGREVARRLAATGAHIIVHGRNKARGDSVVQEITREGKGSARFYAADLASLQEVRAFGEAILRDYQRLDVLVNNAGIGSNIPPVRTVSADGHELRFAVNYLSGFMLTRMLLPMVVKSAPSRIVNVASGSQTPLRFDDIMLTRDYSGSRAYGQSKLAQIMFTFDLAEELRGSGVTVSALHPSTYMNTNMILAAGLQPRSTVEDGAEAVIRLITTPDLESGQYFSILRVSRANAQAYDSTARAQLRTLSMQLTGMR